MKKNTALNIIEKNTLVPGPVSREVLRLVMEDKAFECDKYEKYLSRAQFAKIKSWYFEEKKNSHTISDSYPRYHLFYRILERQNANVTFNVARETKGYKVTLQSPRVQNLRPSILSLLLDKVDVAEDSVLHRKYSCTQQYDTMLVNALSTFMTDVEAEYPDNGVMARLLHWFSNAIEQKSATIFIPICPDYAAEPTGDPSCPLRHTFDGLGSGIGPVAARIMEALPRVRVLFNTLQIEPTFIVGMADFEGYAESNLKRVGLSEKQFMARVSASKALFEDKTHLKTILVSQLSGGKKGWLSMLEEIKHYLFQKKFGSTGLTEDTVKKIAGSREAIYNRWYGKKSDLSEYVTLALAQGAEYSLMGDLITKKFKNCLVLGADSNVFEPFYSWASVVPTLYLSKQYC